MKIRNISEALLPRPKVEYYIDGIIRPASRSIFWAAPGTGKSLVFITMGICFCSPEISSWLGFKVEGKGKVLFIQEEMPDDGFLEFLEETYRGFFGGQSKELPFNFTVFEGANFSDAKKVEVLLNVVKKGGYKMVFVDSFAATISDDENAKKDMQPAMENVKKFLMLPSKPAMIFTHHPTRDNRQFRGSGSIGAAMDLIVQLKGTKLDHLEFIMEKNRYKPCRNWEAKKIFKQDLDEKDMFILERTDRPDNLLEKQDLMVKIIENNPGYGQSELCDAYVRMGGKKIDASGVLRMLDESEVTEVVHDSKGGRANKKIRRLTEAYIAESMQQDVTEVVRKLVNNGHR